MNRAHLILIGLSVVGALGGAGAAWIFNGPTAIIIALALYAPLMTWVIWPTRSRQN